MDFDRLKAALIETKLFNNKQGGLNVTALAKAARVNQPTLLRILNGESKEPKMQTLLSICKVAGVDPNILYGDTGNNISHVSTPLPNYDNSKASVLLSRDEDQLLGIYRNLTPKQRALALRLVSVIN